MTTERPATERAEPAGAEHPPTLSPEQRAAAPATDQPKELQPKPPRTRTSTAFSGFVAGAIVLILLLIFILENSQSVKISYFGASGHVALGVALLLAAVGGALLVGLLGAARIAQVRRHAKRRIQSGNP
jgi:uncharacterized integral membrane protein